MAFDPYNRAGGLNEAAPTATAGRRACGGRDLAFVATRGAINFHAYPRRPG